MNIPEYWARVRAQEAELATRYPDGCLFIQPVNDKKHNMAGGLCVQVPIAVAAKCLVNGTHTIATPEEIARHDEQTKRTTAIHEAQELRNSGLSKVIFGSAKK